MAIAIIILPRVAFDEFDDDELEDDEVDDNESSDDLLECPSCHRAVHEDTQQCPYCGDWIEPVYPGERKKRMLWAIVAIAIIAGWLLMYVLR